jgi:polar amino acid transport system permease protein
VTGVLEQWGQDLSGVLSGLKVSLELTGASLALGGPAGLALALGSLAPSRVIRWLTILVIELGRALPAIVLIQIVYYGLPSADLTLGSFAAATAALAYITAALSSEILRGGINSVPAGHREAAVALGVGRFHTYRSVILPQGIRVALPALLGLAIQIFQATALAFTVGVPELLSRAYGIGNQTFEFLSVLTLAGLIYAAIVLPSGGLVRALELRMGRHLADEQR